MAVLNKYKEEMSRTFQRMYPQMTRQDISQAIDYSINKRYQEHECVLDNNYVKKSTNSTLLAMADYIEAKEPICTAYGVLFKKHGVVPNPLIDLIRSFMDGRDIHKKIMFEYLEKKDYANVAKYNLAQTLKFGQVIG